MWLRSLLWEFVFHLGSGRESLPLPHVGILNIVWGSGRALPFASQLVNTLFDQIGRGRWDCVSTCMGKDHHMFLA